MSATRLMGDIVTLPLPFSTWQAYALVSLLASPGI